MAHDDSYGEKSLNELFNRLAAEQWGRAHRYIKGHGLTDQEAEDILQDSFLRMVLALQGRTLSEIQSMKLCAYFYRVIQNRIKAHWGRPGQNILAGQLAPEKKEEIFDGLIDEDSTTQPELEAVTKERAKELRSCIDKLPKHLREVVYCRFFKEMSLADISARLGRPLNTIKSDLRRACDKLRTMLTQMKRDEGHQ